MKNFVILLQLYTIAKCYNTTLRRETFWHENKFIYINNLVTILIYKEFLSQMQNLNSKEIHCHLTTVQSKLLLVSVINVYPYHANLFYDQCSN